MSYTIYVRPRPIRTALVLDTSVFREGDWRCDALFDGIVASSIVGWGRRQTPIVTIEPDRDLSTDQWKELEAADPDCVHAFAPLNDTWVQRFHTRLMPWRISVEDYSKEEAPKGESIEAHWHWLNAGSPGLATPPTPENIKKLSRYKLLMIEFAPECPLEIRRFFHRNFGTYDQWFDHRGTTARRIAWLEGILSRIEFETVRVSDLASACAALDLLAGSLFPPKPRQALRFIAPNEISAIQLTVNLPSGAYGYTYRVFVGDSTHDFTAYWNELRMCGCWTAPHRHALWVPVALTREAAFMDALRAYLYEYSGQHSSGSRSIELTSETLSGADLEALCTNLRTGKMSCPARAIDSSTRWSRLRTQLRDELDPPRPRALLNSTNAERIRLAERIETVNVAEPEVLSEDGAWAVDVQVEFGASNRFQSPRWWCLPRNSGSVLTQSIFRAPARVTRTHLFAVQIEHRSFYTGSQKVPEIHVALPEESDVVTSLILGRRLGYNYDDVREKQLRETAQIKHIQISDKGQNLRGLIETFGSFWTAEEFCERRFWREALAKLAGQDAPRIETLSERIKNAIRKSLPGKQEAVEETTERITERILPHVKGALEDEPLSYVNLKALLDKISSGQPSEQEVIYISGDTTVHQHGVAPITEEEMKQGINELLARNVIRAGVIVRCQQCGIESWFHVNEVKQFNECSGCGNPRPLTVGAEWRYRLNSLAKRCVSARILSVLQALTAVARSSTASFFYCPSFNLFKAGSDNVWRELDLACVRDGSLIIGEVKDGAFDKEELNRFADIAEAIQPDRAAIFIPQDRFDAKAKLWFSELQKRLNAAGVQVEIYQLPAL